MHRIYLRYTADEYFMEDSDSEESEDEAMSDEDPDWQKTPLFKRIKKLKGRANPYMTTTKVTSPTCPLIIF